MATVLNSFEFSRGRGRKSKYPWDEWADGQIRRLVQGEDFDVKLETIIQSAYHHAKKNGVKVKVTKDSDKSVVVWFTTPPQSAVENAEPEIP
jgi:hypothetical protein